MERKAGHESRNSRRIGACDERNAGIAERFGEDLQKLGSCGAHDGGCFSSAIAHADINKVQKTTTDILTLFSVEESLRLAQRSRGLDCTTQRVGAT